MEQHCYKSDAGLLKLVRFYVCTSLFPRERSYRNGKQPSIDADSWYQYKKYLIPSGILTFFPFTPSTSKTSGKSDSKLFTVNNRFTNDESNRYTKKKKKK
jgi:hypothetical protein